MAKRGETKEKIMDAAAKVFFEFGFEAASVKMILEEAGVVTGSFYHFFASKEDLFEQVVERFLQNYTETVCRILKNNALGVDEQFSLFLREIEAASKTYYNVLEGDRLHWTVQHALHNKTVEALVAPLSEMLARRIKEGTLESRLNVDTTTLAAILVRGIEAIFHGNGEDAAERYGSHAAKENIRAFIQLLLILHPAKQAGAANGAAPGFARRNPCAPGRQQ